MQQFNNFQDILVHLDYCLIKQPIREDAYIIFNNTYIQPGSANDYNAEISANRGLQKFWINRPGGTLIFFPGDFAYGHYGNDAQLFTRKWREFLIKKLQELGLEAIAQNNDILIGNNKITGTAIINEKMALGFISINPDGDLIRAICLKPSSYDFQGLSKYHINAQQVADWFQEFIRKY